MVGGSGYFLKLHNLFYALSSARYALDFSKSSEKHLNQWHYTHLCGHLKQMRCSTITTKFYKIILVGLMCLNKRRGVEYGYFLQLHIKIFMKQIFETILRKFKLQTNTLYKTDEMF